VALVCGPLFNSRRTWLFSAAVGYGLRSCHRPGCGLLCSFRSGRRRILFCALVLTTVLPASGYSFVTVIWGYECYAAVNSPLLCWRITSWFLIRPYLLRYAVLFRYGLSPHNAVVLVLAIILNSVMIDFGMLGQKWLLICCGLAQQMVGACGFVSYRAGGRIHSTLFKDLFVVSYPMHLFDWHGTVWTRKSR
jgi:hypothetical protein